MSIKTTTGIEVSLDTTEVTPTNTKDIVTDNQHCVEIENNESIIEGSKQEYSIVGDGLYASISADEAPQWLVDIVDNVVSTSMLSSFDNYNDLVQEVRSAIDSIDVAANTYVEQINIQSLVDGIIASRLASLNATVEGNTATILDLDTALVNLDESFAQRVTDITASFNDTTDARITEISQARADGDEALAQQITALDASIQDTNSDVSGQASAISGLQIYVGLDGSSDPNGTGVLSRVSILEKQNDGVIEYTTGTYDVMIGVDVDDNTPDNNQLDTSQAPYSTWIAADTAAGTEETRAAHVGDVYIQYSDDGNGNRTYIKSYKFIKTAVDEDSPYSTDVNGYTWALVADTDLQATYTIALEAKDLADNKRRVFTTQPTGPYDIGDLWVKAGTTVNEVTTPQTVNVATASRTTGFLESEWELADEQAKDFIENTWEPESATIKNQIDGKIEYFFYESYTDIADATDEANALDIKDDEWNTQALKENAHGNIVYFKDTRNAYWYNSSIPEWLTVDNTDIYEALQDAASAQGAADGKISQFYAWSGTTAPADYTATITEAVYSTDANGNFLDANGDITTIPSEYVEIEAAVTENISGDSVQYWFKADNTLYYRNTTSWDAVPTTSGTGDKYISAGDLLTVFNPTDRDTTVYTFNGTSWDTTGPTSVISKSRFFTDLDNEVRGPNGIVATTANGIRLDSEAYTDDTVTTLRNSFAYNSTLKIGETYYNTGFGLDASAVTQDPNADGTSASTAYDSEFWINAERFVLKSPSYPDIQAVFTVQASGISLGTEYTEATRNEPKGVYSSSKAYDKGDVVSYNNSSYVAMVNMTVEQNEVPGTNPLKWQLLAAQGVSPVVYEFDGNDSWPTSTNEAGADQHVFDSLFAGNVVVRVLAYDAEGGVNISLNGGTAVPFTRTLGDNTEEWYQFSFDNLTVGSNTLRFWSTTGDGGSIKKVAVSFAGASGLNGGSVDFLFIRSASEPTLPPTNTNWKTDVTQVATGAGDLWSVKEITPLGGGTVTYEGLRVIDAPIIREISIYSTPSASAVAKPTTSTYDFSDDSLTIDDTNWSRSVAGIATDGHKIYVSTALVTGNVTETAKAITWSEPSIYAQRQDGADADALTVTPSYDSATGVTTLSFSDGSTASVSDGTDADPLTVTAETTNGVTTLSFSDGTEATITDGTSSGVKVIYANDADGSEATFTNSGQAYVNYYEWTGSAPTEVPAGLTYTKIVGEDGDSEGVKPIYADDASGTNATFTFDAQEFVNFYEWTGTAPTTVPANLTYVRFKGQERGVKVIYADAADGTGASFTDSSKLYVNYYEWEGTEPTEIPTGLTYVKFIGEDGDSEGVIPIYADDAEGTNATFTFSNQEFVNFYEWTGSAPTTAPADLTYVKFVGEDGVSYTGTTEYYKVTSTDTAPDKYSEGTTIDETWSTSVTTPDSTNKYLWNFNRNTKSNSTFTDSAVTLITQYVEDGRGISSITEQYQKSNSGTTVPTGTWSDTIPELTDTDKYLWNQTTINYTDGVNATTVETLIAVKGEDGTPADVYKFVYKDSLTKPSKPTDNTATGWVDEIPTTINNTLWQSQGKQTQGAGDYVWQEPVQITAKDGLSALLHEWSGSESWPYGAGNSIDTAYKQTFTSAFAGNAFIRVNALDAEGGLQIALNNTVLGTMSGPDNATKWYEFSSESLVVGTNTLSFWSEAVDGGSIKEIQVAFVGAQGIQGITGDYVDFKFTRKTSVPADPGGDDTWYTSVTSVPDGAGDLYSIKEVITNGGATTTYTDKRVIEAPIVREVVMYSGAVTSAPAVPTTDVSYNFVSDSLTDTNTSWSTSFPTTLADGKKVYRITAIAKGNITQTAVSLEGQWSTPAVYAERVDGVSFTGTTEYYAKSSDGTTPPAIGTTDPWFTTPPTLDATNKYLWNYNVVSKSNDTSTNSTPTIVAQYVKDGKGISSISEKYQSSDSGTVVPDGTWSSTIPSLDNTNRYLWNQTTIAYTEGDNTVIETLIAVRGADGVSTDGTDGKSTALLTVYKRSATAITAAPTGGSFNFGTLAITAPNTWSSTIPTGTDPVYASSGVASVTGTTGTDDSISWGIPAKILENGSDGADGDDGVGVDGKSLFEGLIFKRSSTAITAAPTGGSFNFGTNVLTPPTGWSIDIPTGTDPVYTSSGLFEITGSTGTDDTVAWSVPSKTFADGADGVGTDGNSVYQFAIFKRSATAITTAPTGGSYNFTSNTATAPTGWSTTFPASDGNPLYQSTTIATISGATGIDNSLTWSTPSVLVQDGTDGDDGDDGLRGTAVLSHSITDDAVDVDNITNSSTIEGYWTEAASANYAAEIAGDTLILTNTSQTANGGTHIYEYDGTSWASSTAFTINGNAVVEGTLSAAAVGAGHFVTTQFDTAAALTSAGTTMDSKGIRVYDGDGNIRVKIGNLGA